MILYGNSIWHGFCLKFIQKDPKTGELEGLTFEFNLCEAVVTWERVSYLSLWSFNFIIIFSLVVLGLFLYLQLICYLVSLLFRCATVLLFSPRSSLMLYQMDGRNMHGVGLTKVYFCKYCI